MTFPTHYHSKPDIPNDELINMYSTLYIYIYREIIIIITHYEVSVHSTCTHSVRWIILHTHITAECT